MVSKQEIVKNCLNLTRRNVLKIYILCQISQNIIIYFSWKIDIVWVSVIFSTFCYIFYIFIYAYFFHKIIIKYRFWRKGKKKEAEQSY